MIVKGCHRIINEIEKRRDKGQIIHFLTGDAIAAGDNYFYNLYYGIQSLDKSLMLYYFKEHEEFDYFVHVVNSNTRMECYARDKNEELGCKKVEFKELISPPPPPKGAFNRRRKQSDALKEEGQANKEVANAQQQATTEADDINHRLGQLTAEIKKGKRNYLVLLENVEWVAKLYEQPVDTTWVAQLQDPAWQKANKLLVLVTIKDMELLKNYRFSEEETFIANPTAEEIKFAYLRHILRTTVENYNYTLKDLDDIAHAMSVGKRSLVQCMRVLRAVLKENTAELSMKDFAKCIEQNIEEKVTWEDVLLDSATKAEIARAIDKFLAEDEDAPPRKGLILTGPPGTGKTMIAKALASEKNCYFMAPTLADLKGEYVGQTSGKVKRIFAEARGNQPTILFIDEADTVFPSRSLNSGERDSYGLDMVNQFLQELDGAKTGKQKIFTIAATNRVEVVDAAIRSRLSGVPIEIPLPAYDMRRQMFNQKLKPFSLDDKSFMDEVLSRSENMSGRDIDNFTKQIKEKCKDLTILGDDDFTRDLFTDIFAAREKSFVADSIGKGIFSKGNILSPDENKERLKNVIGYENLKAEINKQVRYITASKEEKKRYEDFNIVPAKGVLMYGPPGNAKSKLAEAVAGENGFYFFKILSQDFVSALPERQIALLSDIFQETEQFSKMTDKPGIVLFFDEFDSLVGKNILNPIVRGTMLNFIADERGIRSKDSKILFMAATNFFGNIDEAVKRKGRIDAHLFMDNPTEENGIIMLKQFFAEDKKISPVREDLVQEAYNYLKAEVQSNPEKRKLVVAELFVDPNIFQRLGTDHQQLVRDRINALRPSGSELRTLYNELKESAFLKGCFASDGRLLISADVIAERFSAQENTSNRTR